MTKQTIRPINGKIVVRQDGAQERSPGGLLLPAASQRKPREGKVIAVGPGELNTADGSRKPLEVKEGDRVLFSQYAGNLADIDGDEFIIMTEHDILGVLD